MGLTLPFTFQTRHTEQGQVSDTRTDPAVWTQDLTNCLRRRHQSFSKHEHDYDRNVPFMSAVPRQHSWGGKKRQTDLSGFLGCGGR